MFVKIQVRLLKVNKDSPIFFNYLSEETRDIYFSIKRITKIVPSEKGCTIFVEEGGTVNDYSSPSKAESIILSIRESNR
jgi:hypothetical protein